MPKKKPDFTSADNAIDKFFTPPPDGRSAETAHQTKPEGRRGKRAERFGLLLDGQLKEDLALLSKATNSKSINDFLVTILAEHVGREDSQARLKQYRKLLRG